MTLLDALQFQFRHAARHSPGEVPPVCVVWCDPERQFTAALPALRARLPEFLTLGDWDAEKRTGPGFWIRLAIDRQRPEAQFPEHAIPVVYLPGVARSELRAGDDCPDSWKPLVDLLNRGSTWTQINGKDWTLEALLVAKEVGLHLDVARDERTRRAALGALTALLTTSLDALKNKRLEAEDFDKLMIADTPRDLLSWLSDPSLRQQWDEARWKAFCSRCQADYGWHPEKDGALEAGTRLGQRAGNWKGLWERFCEAPAIYPGLPDLLRKAQPNELALDAEPWPKENDKAETALRQALSELTSVSVQDARLRIKKLEAEHGMRRAWPWAQLGLSLLAEALKHLTSLAVSTAEALGGETLDAMGQRYADDGWKADEAALLALSVARSAADMKAVEIAVHALYRPWLEAAATRFQQLAGAASFPPAQSTISASSGECVLFVDGLRFDLARELARIAEASGLKCELGRRWAGLPSVTATAKPYVMPVAEQVSGTKLGDTFEPIISSTAQPARAASLRKLAEVAGYQVLLQDETGNPEKADARAWAEFGEIDHHGHAHGAKLARHLATEVQAVLERVQALIGAGWKLVRIVTDHGWLLLPGGLPKVDLPKYLTGTRWSRCAVIKDHAHVSTPLASWTWNLHESFAYPPGIACFGEGYEYAHGGLSLQECLVPVLCFAGDGAANVSATITEAKWKGLRCHAIIAPHLDGLCLDLRTKTGDPATTLIGKPKSVQAGRASLLIADDNQMGDSASLVLLDSEGRVISKMPTIIGDT
jgi:hypothetical protein